MDATNIVRKKNAFPKNENGDVFIGQYKDLTSEGQLTEKTPRVFLCHRLCMADLHHRH